MAAATWVLRWANAEGTESIGYLQERLTNAFHARLVDRWSVKTRLFRSVHDYVALNILPHRLQSEEKATTTSADGNNGELQAIKQTEGPHRILYLVSMSHVSPSRQFVVTTTTANAIPEGRGVVEVIEGDVEIEIMITKMKNLWIPRQTAHIDGYTYDLGDFQVHFGNMRVGSGYKGMIIQIDYFPCLDWRQVQGLLSEFIQMLLPPNARVDTNADIDFAEANLSSHEVSNQHTAFQYINLFTTSHLL